jgi:hypothetical protein
VTEATDDTMHHSTNQLVEGLSDDAARDAGMETEDMFIAVLRDSGQRVSHERVGDDRSRQAVQAPLGGLLVRHTTAAMAVTLVLLGVVLFGLNLARPYYATPQVRERPAGVTALAELYSPQEHWVLRAGVRRSDGRTLSTEAGWQLCGSSDPKQESSCRARHGLTRVEVYHPLSQYWRFQWAEAGILLVGAVLLGAMVFVRLSRRAD